MGTVNLLQAESIKEPTNTGAIKKEPTPPIEEMTKEQTSSDNLSKDEKIERAKQLIEQKRIAKQREEEEEQRKKELERRKMGQEVQKVRRDQHEKELQQLREERLREKNEEMAARQRILAQIAQDKADRAKKFEKQSWCDNTANTPATSSVQTNKPGPNKDYNRARLQFRLADGTTHAHDFDSQNTLQDVRTYVREHMNLPYRQFDLSTTFPRRQFDDSNNSQTLTDLQLVPNAVVLILPVRTSQAVTASSPNGLTALVWSFITPFINIFYYVRGYLFGRRTPDTRTDEPPAPTFNEKAAASLGARRKIMGDATVTRRQTGNIHRLSDRNRDSDDENNTWNGNSTQQM